MKRPWENTYWLEPGYVLAGEYPGHTRPGAAHDKVGRLLAAGIDLILDLTQPGELESYAEVLESLTRDKGLSVRHERIPIRDMGIPDSPEGVNRALDLIEEAVTAGRRVYVHCWGGVGRTGTLMGCWLVRQGYSGEDALQALALRYAAMEKSRRHAHSPQTDAQCAYVRSWHTRDSVRRRADVSIQDRFRGALLGLAAGDALGTTLEFRSRGSFDPIEDMVGGGPFRLSPGQWTDDTSMALCLAESLIECGGFDPADQMKRYVRWWRDGLWSSTGTCFDIGNTVLNALQSFQRSGDPFSGSTDPSSAGNGSLMRLAPVVMAYATDRESAMHYAAESSRTTHAAPQALQACRLFAVFLIDALAGREPERESAARVAGIGSVHPDLSQAVDGRLGTLPAYAISASGYVAHTLVASLWAFAGASSFREGALKAVNLGEDADTTGAVFGQLAGAYHGERGIPASWRARIALKEEIAELADRLFHLAHTP